MNRVIRKHGFTNETLEWASWLPLVQLGDATAEQLEVLDESHPKARTSEYYLTLVHDARVLRARSAAFNAIMYAPGGMHRSERELGATVTSRINGCVYCASVHAQRFEQLAHRDDAIEQIFESVDSAGTSARERAIVAFSAALTRDPTRVGKSDIAALVAAGITPAEIVDLIHSVAIFAWANRLMLKLGEPVFPEPAAAV